MTMIRQAEVHVATAWPESNTVQGPPLDSAVYPVNGRVGQKKAQLVAASM